MTLGSSQGFFFKHNKQKPDFGVSVFSIFNTKLTWNAVKNYCHPFWVLDYSVGDCGYCRAKTTSWLKRTLGTVHLYAPNTRYWEKRPAGSLKSSVSFITFYGGERLDLQKYVDNGNGFGRFFDKTGKLEKLLAETAIEASLRGEESYWFVMAKLYEIVDMLHKTPPLDDGSEQIIINPDNYQSHEQIFIEKVRAYLQKHIGENICIADLCSHLNTSASTISHKYRTLTGESPMNTLTVFRINAAKALLIKGEPIKSIAVQTGFYDEFHLSKTFKQITGVPPSRYLKELNKGQDKLA